MDRDILVDGYNVIKNNLMFQTLVGKNFVYARELLVRQLKNRYRHSVERVTVVFDGDGNREQVTHDEHVRIIFSRYGETADCVIARLAAEAQLFSECIMRLPIVGPEFEGLAKVLDGFFPSVHFRERFSDVIIHAIILGR